MLLLYLSEDRMTDFPSAWPHQRKQFISFSSVIFICRGSRFVLPPVWALAKFHITTVFLFAIRCLLILNLWDEMQGAEELCVLLLSSNRNISYTKSAENNHPLSFKKTTRKIWGCCPFSENSETSKPASLKWTRSRCQQSCAREPAGV